VVSHNIRSLPDGLLRYSIKSVNGLSPDVKNNAAVEWMGVWTANHGQPQEGSEERYIVNGASERPCEHEGNRYRGAIDKGQ
jgi:hypothetical protein